MSDKTEATETTEKKPSQRPIVKALRKALAARSRQATDVLHELVVSISHRKDASGRIAIATVYGADGAGADELLAMENAVQETAKEHGVAITSVSFVEEGDEDDDEAEDEG